MREVVDGRERVKRREGGVRWTIREMARGSGGVRHDGRGAEV